VAPCRSPPSGCEGRGKIKAVGLQSPLCGTPGLKQRFFLDNPRLGRQFLRDGGSTAGDAQPQTTRIGYSKVLEYEYRVKTVALDTLKRYSIISLTLHLE
jgi:hypothetical protein